MKYRVFNRAIYTIESFPETYKERQHELMNVYPNALIIYTNQMDAKEECEKLNKKEK